MIRLRNLCKADFIELKLHAPARAVARRSAARCRRARVAAVAVVARRAPADWRWAVTGTAILSGPCHNLTACTRRRQTARMHLCTGAAGPRTWKRTCAHGAGSCRARHSRVGRHGMTLLRQSRRARAWECARAPPAARRTRCELRCLWARATGGWLRHRAADHTHPWKPSSLRHASSASLGS